MRKSSTASTDVASQAEVEQKPVKRVSRSRKKTVAPVAESPADDVVAPKPEEVVEAPIAEAPKTKEEPEIKNAQPVVTELVKKESEKKEEPVRRIPPLPRNLVIRDFVDLWNSHLPLLSDQQIQQLTLQEAQERHLFFEAVLAQVLDYDVVLSDTNIWLELLVGHTSSHSDPRVNARLMFERQLEFISKVIKKKGGRFMIMSETYEEIDRFACQQEPTNYQQADFTDEALCRNVAARLAKRLILSQQRENRLRIEGICSESHHAAFADPAIIRRTVDLFAAGKKILLMTNDASVAIRSLGMCDDLQRINNIDDQTWDRVYAPIRPMAITMDDLKQLDNFTRQYHFLMQAAGAAWFQDLAVQAPRESVEVLKIDENLFRPGDKHERRSDRQAQQKAEQERKDQQAEQQKMAEQRKQIQAEQQKLAEQRKQLQAEQQKLAEQRKEEQRKAQQKADQERRDEQKRREEQRREDQRKNQQQKQNAEVPTAEPVESAVAPASVEEKPAAAPVAEVPAESAPTAEAPVAEPVAENVPLPTFSPEDQELFAAPSPKKRTHRGGRRRGGNKSEAPKE